MNNDISKISSLGRPLNFSYKTNLIIAGLTFVSIIFAFLFFILYEDYSFFEALLEGAYFGISLFLSWAITREIDPDRNVSAFVSVTIAFIFLIFFPAQELLLLFWLLLNLRLVNQIVGKEATILDGIIILAFSAFFSFDGFPLIVLLSAAAFIIDGLLDVKNRKSFILAVLASALFIYSLFNFSALSGPQNYLFIISLIFVSIPLISSSSKIKSKADLSDKKLNPRRIQAAQIFILMLILTVNFSKIALEEIIPAISAVSGAAIYFILKKILKVKVDISDK